MPPINPVFVSAGVIAISVAIVAAIAVYENPELRRIADDFRRRIAVAAQTFHDDIFNDDNTERERQHDDATQNEPVFNRPEDAEGFMLSTGRRSAGDPGVVADEASRRRQREELMYWNSVREAKAEAERRIAELKASASSVGQHQQHKTSFDQFMRQDYNADRGTYVMNTGSDVSARPAASASSSSDPLNGGLVRRRRPEGDRGGMRAAAVYSNPFGDEYGIELDDHDDHVSDHVGEPVKEPASSEPARGDRTPTLSEAFDSRSAYLVAPGRDETMSDIYSATEPDTNNANNANMDAVFDPLPPITENMQQIRSLSQAPSSEVFFDVNDYTDAMSDLSLRLTRVPEHETDSIIPEEARRSVSSAQAQAYDSIQAWAEAAHAQAQAQTGASRSASRTSSRSTKPDENNNTTSPRSLGFYSPLPVTPSVAMSEPSIIDGGNSSGNSSGNNSSSEAGELTPTGSVFGDDHSIIDHADAVQTPSRAGSTAASAADSAVLLEQAPAAPTSALEEWFADVKGDAAGHTDTTGHATADDTNFGVISESEDEEHDVSVMTPTSWSEVGSVVSENEEGPMRS
ncbi:hypothetical protein SCUCBS95973_005524 [Sporothrix curviconia]|uniref:Uncharacterized protein n=1 Tax=Sporothrix curviconia TaxID=1260050 RepID=A0ABP0BXH7_9PEZI